MPKRNTYLLPCVDFISNSSVGRLEVNMHASKDIRKIKCLDGLHYSFELLEHSYKSLYENCASIKTDPKYLIPALSQCWSFVDLVYRIREISQAIPGLSKRNRKLIEFLEITEIAESYRHYIQHLRAELSKKEPNPFPVWGSLSWVDPEDNNNSFLILSGAQIKGTNYTGCVYDRIECKWVSRVCLGVQNLSFNFDPIYEATIAFRDFIIPWVLSNYEPEIRITEKAPLFSVKIITIDSNAKKE